MNWIRCEGKLSWPILRLNIHSRYFLEALSDSLINLWLVGHQAEARALARGVSVHSWGIHCH